MRRFFDDLRRRLRLLPPVREMMRSLAFRWVALWVLAFVLPMAFLGAVSVQLILESARATAVREFGDQAISVATSVRSRLSGCRELAEGASRALLPFGASRLHSESVLIGFHGVSPLVRRLAVVKENGAEWAASDAAAEGRDWSRHPLWSEVLGTTSTTFLLHGGAGETPEVLLVHVVYSPAAPRRLLVCEIDLLGVWVLVEDCSFGRTGRAQLVAPERFALASEDRASVLAGRLDVPEAVRLLLRQQGDSSIELGPPDPKIVAKSDVGVLGLAVLASRDLDEVLETGLSLRWMWIGALLLSLIVVGVGALALARLAFVPLRELSERTRALASGESGFVPLPEGQDEVGRLQAEFNHMVRRLLQMRDLEQRAAVADATERIAHDLGTPLTALKAFVRLLQDEPDSRELLQEFLEVVPGEIERLERLLGHMREYSGTAVRRLDAVNLVELARSVVTSHQPLAREKEVNLSITADGAVELNADPDALRRVLVNLVSNALSATPAGGRVEVTVGCSVEDVGMAEVVVADTGPGVPAALLPRLFRPFVSAREGGMGLGLAICRTIVALHGGEIRYAPHGPGARFMILLPLAREEVVHDA